MKINRFLNYYFLGRGNYWFDFRVMAAMISGRGPCSVGGGAKIGKTGL